MADGGNLGIAYFIMVHHKPYQLEWLLDAIYDENDYFLLHVDLKSRLLVKRARRGVYREVRRILERFPRVRLMPSRFTNWGGWSLSQIALDAIDELLAMGEWRYFINLSGQCYPLRPLPAIREALASAYPGDFVEANRFEDIPADDWHRSFDSILELPVRTIRLRGPRPKPTDFAFAWKGSQWCMLSREFCLWQQSDPLARRIRSYLRRAFLSDELVFQTLLMNSPFRDRRRPHYGREIIWPGPQLLTMRHAALLDASPALFARKFDAAVDSEILVHLADRGGFRTPLATASSGLADAMEGV